jgi:hypothetical protein
MRNAILGLFAATFAFNTVAVTSADARASRPVREFDGPWHLTFATRTGTCDPTYNFDVNISDGIITHPNLVRFKGIVSQNGAVRASVIVQNKSAVGSGRLSSTEGAGSWSGRQGSARCAGSWTAVKG